MRTWVAILIAVFVLIGVTTLFLGENGLKRSKELTMQKANLELRKAELKQEKAETLEKIERLKKDSKANEREVREKLHYIRDDETVFVIQPAE